MFLNDQARQTIEKEEEDNQVSLKLLNMHVKECNKYFSLSRYKDMLQREEKVFQELKLY